MIHGIYLLMFIKIVALEFKECRAFSFLLDRCQNPKVFEVEPVQNSNRIYSPVLCGQ